MDAFIATKAVSIGVLVPSLLPIGALFFAMKYCNLVKICSIFWYMGGNYLPHSDVSNEKTLTQFAGIDL